MSYFRRFRMELDFRDIYLPNCSLPEGYRWLPWNRLFLERHALVKWNAFRDEIDSQVFACLGELDGCRRLMREITKTQAFFPESTWLLTFQPHEDLAGNRLRHNSGNRTEQAHGSDPKRWCHRRTPWLRPWSSPRRPIAQSVSFQRHSPSVPRSHREQRPRN